MASPALCELMGHVEDRQFAITGFVDFQTVLIDFHYLDDTLTSFVIQKEMEQSVSPIFAIHLINHRSQYFLKHCTFD